MTSSHLSILTLDDPAARRIEMVGHATALLSRARLAGLAVPHAHVLLTEPYEVEQDLPAAQRSFIHQLGHTGAAHLLMAVPRPDRPDADLLSAGGHPRASARGPRDLERVIQDLRSVTPTTCLTTLIFRPRRVDGHGFATSCSPDGAADAAHLVEEVRGTGPLTTTTPGARMYLTPAGELLGSSADTTLSPAVCEQLLDLLARARATAGGPVEIEWMLNRRRVWLLAVQPQIRGVHNIDHLGAQAPGLELWTNFLLRENLPHPLTPLTLSHFRDGFLPIVFESLTGLPPEATRERRMLPVDSISGRLYWNANRMRVTPAGALLLRLAHLLDPVVGTPLAAQLGRLHLLPPPLATLRKLWALGHSLRRLLRLVRRALTGMDIVATTELYRRHGDHQLECAQRPLTPLSDEELIAAAAETVSASQDCLRQGLAHELLAAIALRLGQRLTKNDPAVDFDDMIRNATPGPSTRLLNDLDRILREKPLPVDDLRTADSGSLSRALREGPLADIWHGVLREHGHRCAGELDLSARRWSEDPSPLLDALCAPLQDPCLRFSPDGRESTDETGAAPPRNSWSHRRLRQLANLSCYRDLPGWAFAAGLHRLRLIYLEMGRRLHERHLLADPEEVWLLEHPELKDILLGLRRDRRLIDGLLTERRETRLGQLRVDPPVLLRSDGLPCASTAPTAPGRLTLQGTAGAPGRTIGPVRVLNSPAEGCVRPGEVLVTSSFTAGCTPWLQHAAGLITEVGEPFCHAAINARLRGRPAVLGVSDACSRLHTGQRVQLDGTRGTILVIDRTAQPM